MCIIFMNIICYAADTKKSTITRYLVKLFNNMHIQNRTTNIVFILVFVIKVIYSFYFVCDTKYTCTKETVVYWLHIYEIKS